MERGSLDFQYSETEAPQLIKVVGVGGGGGNAVNKMYPSYFVTPMLRLSARVPSPSASSSAPA